MKRKLQKRKQVLSIALAAALTAGAVPMAAFQSNAASG